jgi:hypothetical protein
VGVKCEIMRAIVRLLATHADLARKVEVLEQKYEGSSRVVFDAIRWLMAPGVVAERKRIGFESEGFR